MFKQEKKGIKKLLIFTLFLTFIFNSCCFCADDGIELVSTQKDLTENAKNYFSYLKASYQRHSDPKKSLRSFEQFFSQQKNTPEAYIGFIKLLFDINQFNKIIQIKETKLKEDDFNGNLEIQTIFALSYLNLNKFTQAENLFSKLLKEYPNDVQVAYYNVVAYIKANQLKKALDAINQAVKKLAFRSKHFLFYFLASKIYLATGLKDKALDSINKSLELYSDFGKGWLLKALLEEQLGQINNAISGYKNFLNIVGKDLTVEKQLVQLLFRNKRFKEAADILKKMKLNTAPYYFDLALIEWEGKNLKSALENVNKALKKLSNFKRARLLKVEILIAANKKDEALKFLQGCLQKYPEDNSIIHTMILLKRAGIQSVQLINVFENILKKNKNNKPIISALADLYMEKEDYKNSLNYTEKLLSLVKENVLKSKILFQIGYIYFMTGQKNKVEKTLKKAMSFKPTYPSVYNLLAYFYAENNKNLNEALNLIELALKVDPNCFYYLDTKGVVLLKLEKKDLAIEVFTKALEYSKAKTGNEDGIIKKHLNLAENFRK